MPVSASYNLIKEICPEFGSIHIPIPLNPLGFVNFKERSGPHFFEQVNMLL